MVLGLLQKVATLVLRCLCKAASQHEISSSFLLSWLFQTVGKRLPFLRIFRATRRRDMGCVYQAFLPRDVSPRASRTLGCGFYDPSALVISLTPMATWGAVCCQQNTFASSRSCFSSSEDAMEYSKEFVTAVVLGKDLVPRQVRSG